jgi:hypothetical protein
MEQTNYKVGDTVSWYHGHAYLKVVTILKIEPDRVFLSGMSSEYWMKRSTLDKNLSKAEPRVSSMVTTATFAH